MFKKESIDTGKDLGISLIMSVIAIFFSYFILELTLPDKIIFSEVIFIITPFIFLLIALYLGSRTFGEEKKQGSFEYFFSLRYSRGQLLRNKLFPRLITLCILNLIYIILALISEESLLIKPLLFIFASVVIFLFFTSFSLLHDNNSLNTIYNLIIFSLLYGALQLMINFMLNLVPTELTFKFIMLVHQIFFILTVALFIVFVISFKTIDLANRNFGFMKKNLIRLVIIFGILISLYILINQFDSSKDQSEFSEKDLLQARFETSNGFYRFLTLFEPGNVDIESETTINKYRSLFDPLFDKKKSKFKWDLQSYKKNSGQFSKVWHQYNRLEKSNWNKWPDKMMTKSWSKVILSEKDSIRKLVNKLDTLLARYQALIDSPQFVDFSIPRKDTLFWNPSSYLRYISKIYIAKHMLDCLEGNWERGITALLKHLNLNKEMIRGSRSIYTNWMAKNSMGNSLRAIGDLMNRDDCPKYIYKIVYDSMPDLTYEHFGAKNAVISNYLSFVNYMKNDLKEKVNNDLRYSFFRLFLQENRTRKYVNKATANYIKYEQMQPFKTQNMGKDIFKVYKNFNGFLWWLHNPSGKILINKHWFPFNINGSYQIKALYDIVKISAELRMNDINMDIPSRLKNLESFKRLMDPYSGKHYQYNAQKRVLYSYGKNLLDDKGKQIFQWDKDIALSLF